MFKKLSKPNPYKEFTTWLYNSYPKAELPDWVLKAINPRAVLVRYSNLGNLTVFLEKTFNTYDLMGLDHLEFYKFMKGFVKRFGISQYSYSFFKGSKRDKTLLEIQKRFPYLKTNEISYLLDRCKSDPDSGAFLESLGIRKQEKAKKIKRKKVKGKKGKLIVSTFDDEFIRSIKTLKDWRACFEYAD